MYRNSLISLLLEVTRGAAPCSVPFCSTSGLRNPGAALRPVWQHPPSGAQPAGLPRRVGYSLLNLATVRSLFSDRAGLLGTPDRSGRTARSLVSEKRTLLEPWKHRNRATRLSLDVPHCSPHADPVPG